MGRVQVRHRTVDREGDHHWTKELSIPGPNMSKLQNTNCTDNVRGCNNTREGQMLSFDGLVFLDFAVALV